MIALPVITAESVDHLRAMAAEANAMARACHNRGFRAACHEATDAALRLASAAHALRRELEAAAAREGR